MMPFMFVIGFVVVVVCDFFGFLVGRAKLVYRIVNFRTKAMPQSLERVQDMKLHEARIEDSSLARQLLDVLVRMGWCDGSLDESEKSVIHDYVFTHRGIIEYNIAELDDKTFSLESVREFRFDPEEVKFADPTSRDRILYWVKQLVLADGVVDRKEVEQVDALYKSMGG